MDLYFIIIDIEGVEAEVEINGAAVVQCDSSLRTVYQVNHWVGSGSNSIGVQLIRATGDAMSVGVSLCRGPFDEPPGEGDYVTLATLPWPPETPPTLPTRLETTCELSIDREPFAFETAELLSLTDETRESAAQFVKQLHAIVESKDIDALESAVHTIFDEVGPAYGQSADEAKAGFRDNYSWLFDRDDFVLAPLDESEFAFRYCCGNRLVEIRKKDGSPCIHEAGIDEDGGWMMPMFIGKVGGEWKILR